jgi:hypothetical protein
MKKLLLSVTSLLLAAAAYAQNTTQVVVVVKNYTNYNLFFAPRYNIGFYDGNNDYTFQGLTNTAVGTYNTARDTDYQQEGQFEHVGPQSVKQYSNGNTYVGLPLLANSVDPTFSAVGGAMQGFANQPYWFLKYMKFSWIRFAISTSGVNNASYGGSLAYGFSMNGLSQIISNPPTNTPFYKNANNEIFHNYGPSSVSFSAYGTTIYGQFITAPASGSNPATIHIVFWQ